MSKKVPVARLMDGMSEAQKELEFRRCRDDFEYFCRYFAIKVPGRGQMPLELREAQRETAKVWLGERFSITLKARQIGFSTLADAVGSWLTWFHPDREIIFLSKTGADARKLLGGVAYAWAALPPWLQKRIGKLVRSTQDTFELNNGSKIISLNSNNPARGYSGYAIFVDEAAFFEDFAKAWAAIEPAADVGGRIHVLSTANGVGNGFHEMWVSAVTGVSGWAHIFYSWRASGRSDEWYEAKRRSMPEWQLHQEYPSTPEEAFVQSGRPVFRTDEFTGLDLCEPIFEGYIEAPTGFIRLEEAFDGPLRMWEKPSKTDRYVVGVDVAEGLEHGDFSVAVVINTKTGRVAAVWRGHLDTDEFGDVLWCLGKHYRNALMGIESNNHGHSVIQYMKRLRYGNLFKRYQTDERTNVRTEKIGWLNTAKTKPLVIADLNQALRDGDVILTDERILGELSTYRRLDDRGKMGGQPFDDLVMAIAIADHVRRHYLSSPEVLEENRGPTYDMILKMVEKEQEVPKMGSHNISRRALGRIGGRSYRWVA